jgi:5-methylcytosine-specific restriction enzyme A
MFEKGKDYIRRELHNQYGGQQQGGISTPSKHDFIMLFTSSKGQEHGYIDGWRGDHFIYTGEGQQGDMQFIRGNLAIRDHEENKKHLYLFEHVEQGKVRFLSEMRYDSHEFRTKNDTNGNSRNIIVFTLIPVN